MRTPSSVARGLAHALTGLGIATALAATAAAQGAPARAGVGKALEVTPYAGYMIFGHLIDGPLGTSLTSAPAPVFGAQLGLTIAPGISLIGNVAHASGDLQAGIPFLGGVRVGSTSATIADGGLQLSLPMKTSGLPIAPFVQAGAGAIHWNIDAADQFVHTSSTSFAGNVGAGLDVSLGSSVGLRLLAKDYISKFDAKEATGFNISGTQSHNWGLTAGLRLAF